MNFLAKVGRYPQIEYVMPLVITSVPIVYLTFQGTAHKFWKTLYVAQSSSGEEETFTKNMRDLIQQTATDLHGKILNRMFRSEMYSNPPKVSWFVSATMDPVILGQHDSKRGSLIGIPAHFNYEHTRELPDNLFSVRKFKWLKMKSKNTEEDKSKEEIQEIFKSAGENTSSIEVERFDRNSSEGQRFANSLVLSDKAKKFAVARSLFIGDSAKVIFTAGSILLSCMIGLMMGRIAKKKLGAQHIAKRIPLYIMAHAMAYVNFIYLGDALETYYETWADEKAASVSEEYKRGAIEYIEKSIERNKALKSLVASMEGAFSDNGDRRSSIVRQPFVPLSHRLKRILEIEIKEEKIEEDGEKKTQ